MRIVGTELKFANTSWDSDKAPSFTLVVTGGNIYIDPDVTRLDGVYVAKKSGDKGGTIYTCGNGFAPKKSVIWDASYDNTCNKQLTVNGAFVADQINLMRTYGTLKNGQFLEPNSQPSTPANPYGFLPYGCDNNSGGYTGLNVSCAAEIFKYAPWLYQGRPQTKPDSNGAGMFNAITSLPPVL